MAARAIIGILLGILMVPIIWMILYSIWFAGLFTGLGAPVLYTPFSDWFWSLFGYGDFVGFLDKFVTAGQGALIAPLWGSGSLIEGFGAGALLTDWLPMYTPALLSFGIAGMWAGAIERSAGRGIGVAVGIWAGWIIIIIIMMFINGMASAILSLLEASLLTLIVAILAAAIFGAMTKSEEF
jgi:hypothetical protein